MAPERSASTIRFDSADTAKFGAWPGPMWLKGRTMTTRWPWPSQACVHSASAASFEAAYGVRGAVGDDSVRGSCDGSVTAP